LRVPCQAILAGSICIFLSAPPQIAYGADQICQGFFRIVNTGTANQQVKVYSSISEDSPVVAVLSQGTEVLFESGDRTGNWANIILTKNRMGWIQSKFLKIPDDISGTSNGFLRVKTLDGDSVNLRSEPGYDTTIIASISVGSRVRLLQAEGYWFKVRTESGDIGYMKSSYLICE